MNVLNAKNPLELIEGGLKQGAGLVESAFSPLAPVFKPVGDLIEKGTDKISDTPAVQKFAQTKAGEVIERVAEDVLDATTIASVFGGSKTAPKIKTGAVNTVSKIKDIGSGAINKAKNIVDKTNLKTILDPDITSAAKVSLNPKEAFCCRHNI